MARDIGLLILRLAGLYLAIAHGWGKVAGLLSGQTGFVEAVARLGFPLPLFFAWASALAEFAGGIAMALGLFTRWAAALTAINMTVAAVVRHHALGQLLVFLHVTRASEDDLKAWGNPELATLYLLVCVALILLGPGRLSIDAKRGHR